MKTKCSTLAHNRTIELAVAMLLLICLADCGGGSRKQSNDPSDNRTPTTPAEFLFISLPVSNTIAAYQIDTQTGALTQVPGSPFAAAGQEPGEIAAHPSGRFLYGIDSPLDAESTDTRMVSAYSIAPNGALTPIDSKSTNGMVPMALSIDPTGRYVYTAALLSIIPDGWVIDGNSGMLTPQSNAPTDYQNRFGANGVLVVNGFVYESFGGGIVPFKIDANGKLEWPPEADCPPGATCLDGSWVDSMVLAPGNKFIFAVQWGTGIVSLAISDTPSLTVADSFNVAAGPKAVSGNLLFALDPQGIWAFTIDPNTGAFAPVQGGPFPVSNEGGWLQVEGAGKFLYLATNNSSGTESTITTLAIDSATGALHSAGSQLSLPERVGGLVTSTGDSQ